MSIKRTGESGKRIGFLDKEIAVPELLAAE